MLWRVLIVILSAHVEDIKGKERTHEWRNQTLRIVSSITLTEDQRIQLATPSYKLKKENVRLRSWKLPQLPVKTMLHLSIQPLFLLFGLSMNRVLFNPLVLVSLWERNLRKTSLPLLKQSQALTSP